MVRSPTKPQQAEIYVNKIEAARRQIDAAIRMSLANEDALAIHTVASAGYRILRDLLEKRGKYDLDEIIRFGLVGIASNLARGDLSNEALNRLFPVDNYFRSIIEEIACQIKTEGDDIDINTINVQRSAKHSRTIMRN